MSELIRFGVSLEKNLAERFDEFIKEQAYANRSKAISDLITDALIRQEWIDGDKDIAGAVMMVYDHHKRELIHTLMHIQHDFHEIIVSSQHIHLDHHNCLEVIVVRGKGNKADEFLKKLKALKGIQHVTLSMTTAIPAD